MITHNNRILKEQNKFYQILYQTRQDELRPDPNYLDTLVLATLSEDEKLMLEEPLVYEEVFEAINSLRNSRAPGTEEIVIEVYETYKHKITQVLLDLYNEVLREGKMHRSGRRGIISLIEKIGKDPLFLANWRPLTLLNCDYKILAKILARRMNTVLPKLINLCKLASCATGTSHKILYN